MRKRIGQKIAFMGHPKTAPVDLSSPIPLYAQVEKRVRDLIADPKYQDGALLPDEITLARTWGVSRNTMRAAMRVLVDDGLLERRSGVGTCLRKDRLSSGVAPWISFDTEMKRRGITVEQLALRCMKQPASKLIAQALGIPARTMVLFVERVRGWDDVPSVLFQSYLHPRLGLTLQDDYSRPLSELFADRVGIVPARSVDEFLAVAAVPEVARSLHVEVHTPLLLRRRTVFDRSGKPVEYACVIYRSDRFTPVLTFE